MIMDLDPNGKISIIQIQLMEPFLLLYSIRFTSWDRHNYSTILDLPPLNFFTTLLYQIHLIGPFLLLYNIRFTFWDCRNHSAILDSPPVTILSTLRYQNHLLWPSLLLYYIRFTSWDRLYYSSVFSVIILAPASLYLEEAFLALNFRHDKQVPLTMFCRNNLFYL